MSNDSSNYRGYQRDVERRRLGREEEHGHYRIYGHGERKHAIVFVEHEGGKSIAQHVYEDPEAAKQHLAQIVDEHFAADSNPEENE